MNLWDCPRILVKKMPRCLDRESGKKTNSPAKSFALEDQPDLRTAGNQLYLGFRLVRKNVESLVDKTIVLYVIPTLRIRRAEKNFGQYVHPL